MATRASPSTPHGSAEAASKWRFWGIFWARWPGLVAIGRTPADARAAARAELLESIKEAAAVDGPRDWPDPERAASREAERMEQEAICFELCAADEVSAFLVAASMTDLPAARFLRRWRVAFPDGDADALQGIVEDEA